MLCGLKVKLRKIFKIILATCKPTSFGRTRLFFSDLLIPTVEYSLILQGGDATLADVTPEGGAGSLHQ
jgi:hypothetical protein